VDVMVHGSWRALLSLCWRSGMSLPSKHALLL